MRAARSLHTFYIFNIAIEVYEVLDAPIMTLLYRQRCRNPRDQGGFIFLSAANLGISERVCTDV